MGLLCLPNELTATILNELDIPSLLRCGQVCKLFHSIISESAHLLYKIELFASQLTPGKQCTMDDVARLQALRSYNRAWNDMTWSTHHEEVDMSDGSSWDLSGGVFAQAIRGTAPSISFIQLPCSIKGIPEKRWIVNLQSGILRLRDFYFDVSQDLLICVEVTGTMPNQMVTFYLRTLSMGQDHPQANGPLIQYPLSAEQWNTTFIMQVCGPHFGVIFESSILGRNTHTINAFAVWNWRTGKQEMVVRCPEIRSFSFISEDLILAAMFVSEREPTLDIISVASCRLAHSDAHDSENPMTPLEFSSIPYVCRLRYPPLRTSVSAKDVLIRSEPTPSATAPPDLAAPFSSTGSVDHLYAVTLRANLDDDKTECTVLLTLRSVLLEQVAAVTRSKDASPDANRETQPQPIPWALWGPRNTRILLREPSEVWVCYTYGTRFIQRLPFKDGCVARVYDLNKYAARRRGWVKTAEDPHHLWTPLAKRGKLVGLCYMFDEEVATSLPGRVATIDLPGACAAEGQERGWEAAMIAEDNIVVVSPDRERYGYVMMQ
ncbi:hypothetical protein F5I97DRAFT_1870997 [Phlebopus sp. FC_14]|nr:hypothetical protein F5I97DRAFT_1870997 [Phlebopus sp. FC_14]